MADEELSQREKRAARHKVETRKGAPGRAARKAIVPVAVLLVLGAVAAGFWYTATHTPDCPTHWHGTFDVYVPSKDNASQPQLVSYRDPARKWDIQGGMPERAHMHQDDGFNQIHFEQAGTCVSLREAMGYIDTKLTPTSLQLTGHHVDLGQDGKWTNNATAHLHIYIDHVSNVTLVNKAPTTAHFTWTEESPKSAEGYQLKDMEKALIVFGDYPADQVAQMQANVHDTVSQTSNHVQAV